MNRKVVFSLPVLLLILLPACRTAMSRKDLAKEYYNIGNAFYDLGKTEKAVEYYIRAVELDNSLLKANYNLARAYIEQDQFDQGLAVLEMLLKKDPENTLILETLGYAHFKMGEFEIAREYYEQVLTINELDKSALFNLGILCQTEEKTEEALGYYLKLYQVDPTGDVLKKLGEIYSSAGDDEKAITFYEEYVITKSSDSEAVLALKDLYVKEEYYFKALEKLNDLISKTNDPTFLADYYFEKCFILIVYIGDYQKGIESLNKSVDNGLRDKEKIESLLGEVKGDLLQTIKDLLKKRGVYP